MRARRVRRRVLRLGAGLASGALLSAAAGVAIALQHLDDPALGGAFIASGAITAVGIVGTAAIVWLRYVDTVARPLSDLAAALRVRGTGGTDGPLDADLVGGLGDLGRAADEVCRALNAARRDAEAHVDDATRELQDRAEQLGRILSEIPAAIMSVGPGHRVELYDRQCVQLLGGVAPLGLDRSVFDYLDRDGLVAALEGLGDGTAYVDATLGTADGGAQVPARIRRAGGEGGYLMVMEIGADTPHERPLVFDFDLLGSGAAGDRADTPLDRLACVAFDLETTGLDRDSDQIVQIGAVRIVNGRCVDGETFDTLVDPGRPIPAVSSRIHGIDDAAVADAPGVDAAVARFHRFADGAVLAAHNAPFDMTFLRRAEDGAGCRFDHPVLDTVLLSAAVFGADAPHTLDDIAERLGIEIPAVRRHTALGDAEATGAVVLALLPALKAEGIATLGEAVEAMRAHRRLLPDLND